MVKREIQRIEFNGENEEKKLWRKYIFTVVLHWFLIIAHNKRFFVELLRHFYEWFLEDDIIIAHDRRFFGKGKTRARIIPFPYEPCLLELLFQPSHNLKTCLHKSKPFTQHAKIHGSYHMQEPAKILNLTGCIDYFQNTIRLPFQYRWYHLLDLME